MTKRAAHEVKGLQLEWMDNDPLCPDKVVRPGTSPPGKVWHSNPVFRFCAGTIFRCYGDWLVNKQRLRWYIAARVIFRRGDTDEYVDLELQEVGTIAELNEFLLRDLEIVMLEADAGGYREQHLSTTFRMHCLGQ